MKQIIFWLFLGLPTIGWGQTLSGKIIDDQGEPIPGAYIFFHKTEQHAHSSVFGEFTIDGVAEGDTLVISHLGYKGKTIIVDNVSEELLIKMDEQVVELGGVVITPELDAINLITKLDLSTNPVRSSQALLMKVPGLIIGQHAGGGKAEQIFLRGFDIDHGTDINITVDGLPVNMVSHAHGQGYADLHFLIPEIIKKIDFGKGPYYADQGNFATAGYAAFQTKDRLENNSVQLEYGQFNTKRLLGLFNILSTTKTHAYLASEYRLSDGPFESPQHFNRINLFGKYTTRLGNEDKISLLFSTFNSKWDASGQIPERLVSVGEISRFGAVDDTEGGYTGRTNFKFGYVKKIDNSAFVRNDIYFTQYDFELYSNFTFFLLDTVNGDQIRQKENRRIFGGSSEWNKTFHTDRSNILFKAGLGIRNDRVKDVELSHTLNRATTLEYLQLGDVDETNLFGYIHTDIEFGRWLINPVLRADHFVFNYNDHTDTLYQTQSAEKSLISPKLNILYNQSKNLQFNLKAGTGFHSNDTRVVVARNGREILPMAYGSDIGLLWKPFPKLLVNTAYWWLFMEQEFVYVGDAGIVEPSGRTRRSGVDFGMRYQFGKPLFIYGDINYAIPRAIDEPAGQNLIPLAPDLTATGGFDIVNEKGFSGGAKFRYIRDRPANEDNSIVAEGYFITDLNVNFTRKNVILGVAIENVFDQEWKETQFATTSRLFHETEPVEEIHFTPGTPFFIKGSIRYQF